MAQRPRPPLPPGPYLVVGSRAPAWRRRWPCARPARASDRRLRRGTPAEAAEAREGLARAGVEVHLESDGTQPWRHRRRLPRSSRAPGSRRMRPSSQRARREGLEVIGELELGWRLRAERVHRGDGHERKDDDGRADRRDAPRGRRARGRRRQRRHAGQLPRRLGSTPPPPSCARRRASSSRTATAFAPEVGVFLNLAEDHLDRHATLDALPRREAAHLRQPASHVADLRRRGRRASTCRRAARRARVRLRRRAP